MSCEIIKKFTVPACADSITIDAGLQPGKNVFWQITHLRTKNLYQKQATVDDGGKLTIALSDLPSGLINQYAGTFELRIRNADDYRETIAQTYNDIMYESVFFECVQIFDAAEENSIFSSETVING